MNLKKNQPAIGIDLGTTYSVISYINDTGRPETIPNQEGDLLTPSVILFDGDSVIVGKEAAKAMATEYENVIDCPKRQVGARVYSKTIGGRKYPPEALQGWVLSKLRNDAQRVTGVFNQAVITVPAYFDEVRRKSTQEAGFIAGLDVLDIINEPTAAAIAFGSRGGWLTHSGSKSDSIRVLVYDLGGGTFDVTIMEIRQNEFRTLVTDGDMRLGGHDWDQRLVDHVARLFATEHGIDPRENDESLGQLLRDAKAAKETLSVRSQTNIQCNCLGNQLKVPIRRLEFEKMTQDLVDRSEFTVREALKAAQMSFTEVDYVLLVGGSTRMPAIREMLRQLTGKEPDDSLSPDEAVSHGAAIRSAILQSNGENQWFPPAKIINVNSHSLGVVASNVDTRVSQVVPVIPRNTPLPVVARKIFKVHKQEQESVLVQIVEGESTQPDECSLIGRCAIWELPNSLPVGSPIEVRFMYEENGRLQIKVKISGAKRSFRYELERPNSLTEEQLKSWREYICEQ